MKAKVYNLKGEVSGNIELKDSIFKLPANDELVHQVYVAISSNRRQVLAHTKTRGDRAGSGIKPWRQKGTGRARVGSVRTPVWRKGGVVFGPRNDRNYKKKVNQKMNAKAIATVLSGKLGNEDMIIVENFDLEEKKTKAMAQYLKNLKIQKSALIVFDESEKDWRRFSKNIRKTNNTMVAQMNVYDLLNTQKMILSKKSVEFLEAKYDRGAKIGKKKELTQ